MLIMSREIEERIMIGDNIIIQVTAINKEKGTVKIGIDAPKEVPVHREEVYNAIHKGEE